MNRCKPETMGTKECLKRVDEFEIGGFVARTMEKCQGTSPKEDGNQLRENEAMNEETFSAASGERMWKKEKAEMERRIEDVGRIVRMRHG